MTNPVREPRGRYDLLDEYGRLVATVNSGTLYPTRYFPDWLIGGGWPAWRQHLEVRLPLSTVLAITEAALTEYAMTPAARREARLAAQRHEREHLIGWKPPEL